MPEPNNPFSDGLSDDLEFIIDDKSKTELSTEELIEDNERRFVAKYGEKEIDLDSADQTTKDIFEKRALLKMLARKFKNSEEALEKAKNACKDMSGYIAESEKKIADLIPLLSSEFQESELQLPSRLVDYANAIFAGGNPTLMGYSKDELNKVYAYVDRRRRDEKFNNAVIIYEALEDARLSLKFDTEMLVKRNQGKQEAVKNLEKNGEEVEKVAMELSKLLDLV